MKRWLFASALLSMLQVSSYGAEVEYSGIVEVMPGNVLLSSDLSNLSFTGYTNGKVIDEGLDSDASYMPSVSGGLDATNGVVRFQLLGGLSTMTNSDFSATVLKLEAAAYYMGSYSNKLGIGAHITSLSFLSPSWSGSADASFSDTNGIAPGISVIFGNEWIVKGSVDYVMGTNMDITTKNGTVSNYSSISLDGVMVQLGLMYKF